MGSLNIAPLHTLGHTDGHFAYRLGDRLFTDDALLIDGCGRTDFQNGDAETLYKSVREKLFVLPDDCLVYPAHDYNDRRVTTIAQEKKRNPRIGINKTLDEFKSIMDNLNLPGNKQCGVCPEDLPDNLLQYCQQIAETHQG